jgi:AraC-like DNA-binding protein
MKDNICKFPLPDVSNDLTVSCFVLETDESTMRKNTQLTNNRLLLIEQGEGVFLCNGTPCSFVAGTLLFCFKGETIALHSGENVRYFYIDFSGARGNNLLHRFGIIPNTRAKDNFNSCIPFCKDCLLTAQQENLDIIAESVLLYIFSKLSAKCANQNEIIQKIIEFTEDNFQNTELSIAHVAKAIGYSSKYLSHYFKKNMQMNYGEYLRSVRFKYAISLFELGISSVKNVALLSGFSDPLYFSTSFKKATGVSPKEFIAQQANKNTHA